MKKPSTKKLLPLIFLHLILLIFTNLNAQIGTTNGRGLVYKIPADSLLNKKQYGKAATLYMHEYTERTLVSFKRAALINAAYCFAAMGNYDSSLIALEMATYKYGLKNINFLVNDSLINPLFSYAKFNKIKQHIDKQLTKEKDYKSASIITTDIPLFWRAYDLFLKDTIHANQLFMTEYFEKGTAALQEYYRTKTPNIGGLKGFVDNMKNMQKFYASIRANTLKVDLLKDTIRLIYKNLNQLYANSVFPQLTFHIGGWSSGGTASDYGLHVGVDIYASNLETDKSELNAWQKRNSQLFSNLKHIVAHELIHAQQSNMRKDTTLLKYVIVEGMADFIGELISGKPLYDFLLKWANGNEKKIWQAFKKEMYLDRYYNWIGNSEQERADWPADLGYWVGYQICKSYYEQAVDKKKAIYEMLHLSDYRDFYEKSKVEKKLGIL